MPRKHILSLLMCLVCLTGCAGRSHDKKQDFLALRANWLAIGQTELYAAVRADYGARVYDYVLRYSGSPEGGILTVEKPEMIAGVGVELGEEGIKLHWDGAELDTGAVLGNMNPVQAFPLLLKCWQSGPVLECWEETHDGISCLTVEFDLSEAGSPDIRRCRTWFSLETEQPAAAELSENGRTVLFVNFMDSRK